MVHTLLTSSSVTTSLNISSPLIITLSDLDSTMSSTNSDPYFNHHSSLILADHYVYSETAQDYYGFESYHLRSSFLKDQVTKLILQYYNRYNNYTLPNHLVENQYLIYEADTHQAFGIIVVEEESVYIIQSRTFNFEDSSFQQKILDLIHEL